MRLSKREKTLIYIMVCMIVACVGIVLIILPSLTKMQDDTERYNNKYTEKQTMEQTINQAETVKEQIRKSEKEYNEKIDKYAKKLTDEQIDSRITTIIRDGGFTPAALEIGTWQAFSGDIAKIEEEKTAPVEEKDLKLAEDGKKEATETAEKETEKNADTVLLGADLTVQAFGPVEKLVELIKLLNDDASIVVRNYKWASTEQESTPILMLELKILCRAE